MNKQLLIKVSIACLLLLVIAASIFHFKSNSCFLSSKTANAKSNCYIKAAIELNDEKYCSLLENKYENWTSNNLMGACYTELAVIHGDTSYCEKTTGKYLDIVKSQCYTSVAFAKNESSVCEQYNTSYGNSFCYSWFSDIANDPNLCLKIKDANGQSDCVWRHKNDNLSKKYFFCDDLVSQKAMDLCNQVGIVKDVSKNKPDPIVQITSSDNDKASIDSAIANGSITNEDQCFSSIDKMQLVNSLKSQMTIYCVDTIRDKKFKNQQTSQKQTYQICGKDYMFQSIPMVNNIDLVAKFANLTKNLNQSQKEVCADFNTLFNNKTIGLDLKEQQKTYYLTMFDISDTRYVQQIEIPTATVSYSWETNTVYYFPSTLKSGEATYVGDIK